MNREFSITFWIRLDKNPKWADRFSDINFPPITSKEGIQVYFSKKKENFVVYILHPAIGYRKISTNVKDYLEKDAFIAVTNSEQETKLYLNADLVKTVKTDTLIEKIDVGDYVMIELRSGDSSKISTEGLQVVVPAKIISFDGSNVVAEILNVGEIVKVPKSQIKV